MFISQTISHVTIMLFYISQNTDNPSFSSYRYGQTCKAITDCKIQPVSQTSTNPNNACMLAAASTGHWYFAKCETTAARCCCWKSAAIDGDRREHLHVARNIYMSPGTFTCRQEHLHAVGAAFGGCGGTPDSCDRILRHLVAVPGGRRSPSASNDHPCIQSSPPMGTCCRSHWPARLSRSPFSANEYVSK